MNLYRGFACIFHHSDGSHVGGLLFFHRLNTVLPFNVAAITIGIVASHAKPICILGGVICY